MGFLKVATFKNSCYKNPYRGQWPYKYIYMPKILEIFENMYIIMLNCIYANWNFKIIEISHDYCKDFNFFSPLRRAKHNKNYYTLLFWEFLARYAKYIFFIPQSHIFVTDWWRNSSQISCEVLSKNVYMLTDFSKFLKFPEKCIYYQLYGHWPLYPQRQSYDEVSSYDSWALTHYT